MKNTDSIITEFKEIRENFNTPIGSRHWLIRQEQVEKDTIDWLKQKLDQVILQTKSEIKQEVGNDCKHKFEVLHIKKGNAFDFVLYGCGKCGRMKTKSV